MTDDAQLLNRYVNEGHEPAFGELVARYINLVYSAAMRQADPHLAEDIVQTVFTALARKARTLPKDVVLGGWLYRHTCFVASQAMRTERRRRLRERQVVEMDGLTNDQPDRTWEHLAPHLDDAMQGLGTDDRDALVLRFFEKRDFRDVGTALGVSEEAARKRVTRAVEKLRLAFAHRGLALTGATLATTLAAQSLLAAPAGLAVSVTGTALAGAAGGTGLTLSILKLMAMTKLQIAVSTVVVAGMSTVLVLEHQAKTKLRDENASLQQQVAQIASLSEENQRLSNLAGRARDQRMPDDQLTELLRLRAEVSALRSQTNELAKLRSENQQARSSLAAVGRNRQPGEPPPPDHYPKDSWTFAGYANPRAAFQSAIWARTVGDGQTMLASWSPEERAREEEKLAREGKTLAEEIASATKEMEQVKGYRILYQEVISDDEIILTVQPEGIDEDRPAQARMVRVGNEWKFGGFGKKRARQSQASDPAPPQN